MARRILVYGGKGALGNACVHLFKNHGFTVDSIDFAAQDAANSNVVVTDTAKWEEQADLVLTGVAKLVGDSGKFDAVVCVAGGWQGGSVASDTFVRSCDAMWRQSVWTSTIAARIASQYLIEDGTLVLMGANAAFASTPSMIGYGMAKAAVHHLVHSLASGNSGLPAHTFVAVLCPITLDTPANRAAMPQADTSTWTPLDAIANRIHDWIEKRDRPANGSHVRVETQGGQTKFIAIEH